MMKSWQLPRRTFLRGLGTSLALPLLDVMLPQNALSAASEADIPTRMAFLFVPNGIHMPDWTPSEEGGQFTLPSILEPLEPMKDDLLVLSGLAQKKANANGDGGGDHARAAATFLTGCQAHKTSGKDIRIGVSVDQVAAQHLGRHTSLSSLELGCERAKMAGSCDTGYSCAYTTNMSWRSESTPMPKEINPRAVFDRLFRDPEADQQEVALARRERYRKSVLDLVLEDAADLKKKLGRTDRRKMDEYLESVRALEQRIENGSSEGQAVAASKGVPRPKGIPGDYGEHVRLMGDLMVLAFQLDITRISTFMLANAGSNRTYRNVGVSGGHHQLSHHRNDETKMSQISKINRFHMEQFAYMLKKMKAIKEGDGTLLDHSMILYGSCIGNGDRHNHNDLPILLAGRGGGSITSGRHIRYEQDTPLMNLYLAMLDRVGVSVDSLGDSTGKLDRLSA